MCGFPRRTKFSIKPRLVFGTAGSTTKRRVPHPLRCLQRVGYATVGIEIRGIPPFAKKHEGPWISYCAAPAMAACAAFFKEGRMKFVETTKPYGKSGEAPPLFFALVELSAVAPFWESIGNQSLLSQVRWGEPGAPKSNESASGLEHGFKAAVHLFLLDKLTALGGR